MKVKCDVCGMEKELTYRFYIKSFNKHLFYSCSSKCSKIKSFKTNIDKYGDENYNNRDKYRKTCLEKFGTDNPSKNLESKNKRINTMLEKYGVNYYVLSEDFKDKSEKTSMINYGVPHPQMSKEMLEFRKNYHIKMGYNILTDDFDLYKRKVYNLTKKFKNQLMKVWDGKDYYDGEFIKNNFQLPYHDGNYPTIDHKITIFEGFKSKMNAEEIADVSNLCFTKRSINSRKYIKNESSFII